MLFEHIEKCETSDPIGVAWYRFIADENPQKINLTIGAYRDQQSKPYVFKIVEKVQRQLVQSGANHEYLKMEGHDDFRKGAQKLAFINCKYDPSTVSTIQTISGNGAVSLGFDFFKRYLKDFSTVYLSTPTWTVYTTIAKRTGVQKLKYYRYYEPQSQKLDFQGMCEDLKNAQDGSVIVLQVSSHNPTGIDLNLQQWEKVAQILKGRKILPFFDSAYQGFASGDFQKDGQAVKVFLEAGFTQFIVCQSFAKNMGLYGQRIGALHVKFEKAQTAKNAFGWLKQLVSGSYMTAPLHGALIASQILNNQQNFKVWSKQLKQVVVARVKNCRKLLRQQLERIQAPGDWSYMTQQIGMMSMTGLTQKQVEKLRNQYHVYMPSTGRISFPGVNKSNVEYIARAIKTVLTQEK